VLDSQAVHQQRAKIYSFRTSQWKLKGHNNNIKYELTVKPLETKAASYKSSIALRASSSSGFVLHAA